MLDQWWRRSFPLSFWQTLPLKERLTLSALMLRMKRAPFKAYLCSAMYQINGRDGIKSSPLMGAHLFARQQLPDQQLPQLYKNKGKTEAWTSMWNPVTVCAAVNTPGLRNGNWTRKAKTQGGQDGGWKTGGEGRGGTTQRSYEGWFFF